MSHMGDFRVWGLNTGFPRSLSRPIFLSALKRGRSVGSAFGWEDPLPTGMPRGLFEPWSLGGSSSDESAGAGEPGFCCPGWVQPLSSSGGCVTLGLVLTARDIFRGQEPQGSFEQEVLRSHQMFHVTTPPPPLNPFSGSHQSPWQGGGGARYCGRHESSHQPPLWSVHLVNMWALALDTRLDSAAAPTTAQHGEKGLFGNGHRESS